MGQSSACMICGHGTEDILHVIRDCSLAKKVWRLVVLAEKLSRIGQNLMHNWVHLHSDGAITRDSGYATAGGLIRDSSGNWIVGFTHYLESYSPLEVEFWGILDGVLIALSKGYSNVRIQTENLEVIKALSSKIGVDSGITVLRRVKRLLRSEG
ncbi:hypothetical protein J1N35_035266 [Gossypium stocksii]|uniref:RNase H type-1 domain-containing protein n=1 Tax=Gossypium stocksii TaxID=47602 RepID=A0A9D3ZQ07_9ROSI|nr:hypothetical protein J1N35_035266 [Gossypium stocksii]